MCTNLNLLPLYYEDVHVIEIPTIKQWEKSHLSHASYTYARKCIQIQVQSSADIVSLVAERLSIPTRLLLLLCMYICWNSLLALAKKISLNNGPCFFKFPKNFFVITLSSLTHAWRDCKMGHISEEQEYKQE